LRVHELCEQKHVKKFARLNFASKASSQQPRDHFVDLLTVPPPTEISPTRQKNGKLRNRFKETIAGLFGEADVLINGARPWDMAVHDDRFYQRVLADGIIGLG